MKKVVKFTVLTEMDESQDDGDMQELVADALINAGLDVNYVSSVELDENGDEIIKGLGYGKAGGWSTFCGEQTMGESVWRCDECQSIF